MEKTSTKRFFPALLLMLIGCLWGNSAWAEDVTVTPDGTWTATNDQITKTASGVTFDFSGGSTKPTYYSDGLRTYEGCIITISAEQSISKITFTYTISNPQIRNL